jgi:phage-related protein
MSETSPQKIEIVFYQTANGRQVLLEWLRELDASDRAVVGQDLMRVQFGWPVGMPLCRSLGHGLWEVRTTLPSGRIARVLFSFTNGKLLALHGIVKKSQKTPKADLDLARQRKSEFEQKDAHNE